MGILDNWALKNIRSENGGSTVLKSLNGSKKLKGYVRIGVVGSRCRSVE